MADVEPGLARHQDRLRWNARYRSGAGPTFAPHPLARRALSMSLPAGPVLDLACGPSGSALLAAAAGRRVVAVDASDAALELLAQEAGRRGLAELISLVHADLGVWRPQSSSYSLVLCTGYWDRGLFPAAAGAVVPGGAVAWEAFTIEAMAVRPRLPEQWCLQAGEPASLLGADFEVSCQHDLPDGEAGMKRRLLARRLPH